MLTKGTTGPVTTVDKGQGSRLKVAAVALAIGGTIGMWAGPALAASVVKNGTRISTTTETKTITSSKCYHTHRVTITPYHWSKKGGWIKYVAPKKTVTDTTTCH